MRHCFRLNKAVRMGRCLIKTREKNLQIAIAFTNQYRVQWQYFMPSTPTSGIDNSEKSTFYYYYFLLYNEINKSTLLLLDLPPI